MASTQNISLLFQTVALETWKDIISATEETMRMSCCKSCNLHGQE
jgi:hypothetical protein